MRNIDMKDLQKLATNLYNMMFNEVLKTPVIFMENPIGKTLGATFYRKKDGKIWVMRIEISKNLLNTDTINFFVETLKHELIHLYVMTKYAETTHGKYFRRFSDEFKVTSTAPGGGKSYVAMYLPEGYYWKGSTPAKKGT